MLNVINLTVVFFYSSLHSELDNVNRGVHTVERAQETDSVNLEHKGMVTSPVTPPAPINNNTGRVQTRKEQRSGNTLYQELSFQVCYDVLLILLIIFEFFLS